jgi:hypothetical protein
MPPQTSKVLIYKWVIQNITYDITLNRKPFAFGTGFVYVLYLAYKLAHVFRVVCLYLCTLYLCSSALKHVLNHKARWRNLRGSAVRYNVVISEHYTFEYYNVVISEQYIFEYYNVVISEHYTFEYYNVVISEHS